MPIGSEIIQVRISDDVLSAIVSSRRSHMRVLTLALHSKEYPMSPCTKFVIQMTYCSNIVLSSPNLVR